MQYHAQIDAKSVSKTDILEVVLMPKTLKHRCHYFLRKKQRFLEANDDLSLQSMKVYPSELVQSHTESDKPIEESFEKNMISIKLKGGYSSVFSYLEKIENLQWNVYWQDVKYSVDDYPTAEVDIHLYTLSIIEEHGHDV